jgi:hypothetical protein
MIRGTEQYKRYLNIAEIHFFKIQSFWSDDNTFPDALDSGIIISCANIDIAIKEAFKNIKPQVKPYIEIEVMDSEIAQLQYMPTPSKNRTGYIETIEISESTQEEFEAQDWVKFDKSLAQN